VEERESRGPVREASLAGEHGFGPVSALSLLGESP